VATARLHYVSSLHIPSIISIKAAKIAIISRLSNKKDGKNYDFCIGILETYRKITSLFPCFYRFQIVSRGDFSISDFSLFGS